MTNQELIDLQKAASAAGFELDLIKGLGWCFVWARTGEVVISLPSTDQRGIPVTVGLELLTTLVKWFKGVQP